MRKTFHLPVPDSFEGVDFHAGQQTPCYLKTETGEAAWWQKDDSARRRTHIGYGITLTCPLGQTEVLQGLVPKVELEPLRVLGRQSLPVD
jgi:hypothetical protein